MVFNFLGSSFGNNLATVPSRCRADVNHIIGAFNHIFVVLHDYNGIAYILQLLEGKNQALIIALVQANTGLVQNIEHAHQLRANLRCKSDALRLTARK